MGSVSLGALCGSAAGLQSAPRPEFAIRIGCMGDGEACGRHRLGKSAANRKINSRSSWLTHAREFRRGWSELNPPWRKDARLALDPICGGVDGFSGPRMWQSARGMGLRSSPGARAGSSPNLESRPPGCVFGSPQPHNQPASTPECPNRPPQAANGSRSFMDCGTWCCFLAGRGMRVEGRVVCYLEWADDTWLHAKSPEELDYMTRTVTEVASRRAGLGLRLPKCRWTQVRPAEGRAGCGSSSGVIASAGDDTGASHRRASGPWSASPSGQRTRSGS